MSPFIRSIVAVMFCALGLGCDHEHSDAPSEKPAPLAPAAPEPRTLQYSPTYTLAIADNTVTWTAEVNTGGWKMTADQVLVEDSMGKTSARIYVTLEQPGTDEGTTQAMETLEGKYVADRKIDTAELSVRRQVRNQTTIGRALYSVVKNAGS